MCWPDSRVMVGQRTSSLDVRGHLQDWGFRRPSLHLVSFEKHLRSPSHLQAQGCEDSNAKNRGQSYRAQTLGAGLRGCVSLWDH